MVLAYMLTRWPALERDGDEPVLATLTIVGCSSSAVVEPAGSDRAGIVRAPCLLHRTPSRIYRQEVAWGSQTDPDARPGWHRSSEGRPGSTRAVDRRVSAWRPTGVRRLCASVWSGGAACIGLLLSVVTPISLAIYL